MRRTMRLSERDLQRLVSESVNRILYEGNFFDTMSGALKGARGGYAAQRGANGINPNSVNIEQNILKTINNLYKLVGSLAVDYQKYKNDPNADITGCVMGIKRMAEWLYDVFCERPYKSANA